MNKSELITAISEEEGVEKKQVEALTNALFKKVMETVSQGDTVQIVGFGTFASVHRSARELKNPRTGDVMQIPVQRTPKFKAGKTFKNMM